MGKRAVTAQRPFTMIVAALRQGSDPSLGPAGNPQIQIETYRRQSFPEIPGRGPEAFYQGIRGTTTRTGLLANPAGTPQSATATIEVNSNVFLGPTSILLGEFVLISGEDFVVAASAALTATAIATVIDALPGYSAAALLAVVTVTGPVGLIGNEILLDATGVSPGNVTLTPFAGAEPLIGAPAIT